MTVSVPSVDDSFGLKLLPAILSIVAGSADVISFLGLRALFVAHITGNLIIIAAHLVTGTRVDIDPVLSVPVFILALALTRVAVAGLEALGIESLRPLLMSQFVLLAGFLTLAVLSDARANPNSPTAVLAAMLGVSAMATQNALVQVSIHGAPSTAVMTTNITRFTMDAGEVLLGRDPSARVAARRRASHTWPAIIGFAVGAALGAALYAAAGLVALALPAALALIAIAATHTRTSHRGPHLRRRPDAADQPQAQGGQRLGQHTVRSQHAEHPGLLGLEGVRGSETASSGHRGALGRAASRGWVWALHR
jgi:uncharacterized membrane protein YoaK (UPF0700 family)